MKILHGVTDLVKDLRGETFKDPVAGEVKIQDFFMIYLGSHKTNNHKEIIRARKLADRFFTNTNQDFILEDADYELLKKSMETINHPTIMIATALEVLEDAKPYEIPTKEKENVADSRTSDNSGLAGAAPCLGTDAAPQGTKGPA